MNDEKLKKSVMPTLINVMLTSIFGAVMQNLINPENVWIFSLILFSVIGIIFIFAYPNVSELLSRILNKLHNNTRKIGIVLTVIFIILFLFSPFYINHIILLLFAVPIVLIVSYSRLLNYYKIISVILVVLCILLFAYYINAYFNVYPDLFNLYLNGYFDRVPSTNTVSNYRFSYIILCIYSLINMILGYIVYKPEN